MLLGVGGGKYSLSRDRSATWEQNWLEDFRPSLRTDTLGSMSTPLQTTISLPFDEAVAATRAALAEEGFGVLTEIDIQATMKEKLNEDYPPTLVLGACNPPFAHKAMTIAPDVATLVPCNVVLRETAEGVTVETVDPQMLVDATGAAELAPLAADLRVKLERALDSLQG